MTLPALLLALVLPAAAMASDIKAVDGDTVRFAGDTIRIVGLNAPETGSRAQCEAERRLGVIAKARLQQIIDRGRARIEIVACSCPPSSIGTKWCNYARPCGILWSGDGVAIADIMISEGMAVEFVCGETRCPPTPKPWCE